MEKLRWWIRKIMRKDEKSDGKWWESGYWWVWWWTRIDGTKRTHQPTLVKPFGCVQTNETRPHSWSVADLQQANCPTGNQMDPHRIKRTCAKTVSIHMMAIPCNTSHNIKHHKTTYQGTFYAIILRCPALHQRLRSRGFGTESPHLILLGLEMAGDGWRWDAGRRNLGCQPWPAATAHWRPQHPIPRWCGAFAAIKAV